MLTAFLATVRQPADGKAAANRGKPENLPFHKQYRKLSGVKAGGNLPFIFPTGFWYCKMFCFTKINFTMKKIYLFLGLWVALFSANAQTVADFENIQLDSASWYNGSNGAGGFNSGGIWFPNDYNADYQSWSGFSVSNMKDTVTPGYENQYSAIAGGGVAVSENYAVAYFPGSLKMEFDSAVEITGFNVTNSTYAYLAMRDGGVNGFAKKFGGADGTDPDYLKLLVWGVTDLGNSTDTVEFFLADYRFENTDDDYLADTWEWMNLSSLGEVTELHFGMESTDTSEWGLNTPAYFCIDNFTIGKLTSSGILINKKNKALNVYPNPVNNFLHVELPENVEMVVLSDLAGRIFYRKKVENENILRISGLKNYPPGLYLLKVKNAEGYSVSKILKK
jgi:hypothetical protein